MDEDKSKKVTIYDPKSGGEKKPSSDFNIIAHALGNLSQKQRQEIAKKAAETAIEIEKNRIDQDDKYHAGRRTLDAHMEAFEQRDQSGLLPRHNVTSEHDLGAGKIRVTSKSGATCFVATATFRDKDHPTVRSLCAYRDTILIRHKTGRIFIKLYWRIGPVLATWVDKCPWTREPLKKALTIIASRLARAI